MVGYADSPICIVHADMTLTDPRSRSRGDDSQPPYGAFYVVSNTVYSSVITVCCAYCCCCLDSIQEPVILYVCITLSTVTFLDFNCLFGSNCQV